MTSLVGPRRDRNPSQEVPERLVIDALAAPALTASNPQEWLATHLGAFYAIDDTSHDHGGEPTRTESRWWAVPDLVADGGPMGQIHRKLVGQGLPPQTAGTYLAGWIGGMIAEAIGFALATGGAGFVCDPSSVRLHLHPAGWGDAVDLGQPVVVVQRGHPWCDRTDVDAADDSSLVLARSVQAMVGVCEPIVDRCRSLAPVGRAGLWNEIGDRLGGALAYQDQSAVTDEMVAVLRAALRVPGVPWRATPTVRFVDSPALGPILVAHKGGCCLAYKVDRPEPEADHADADLLAYRQRFPHDPGAPRYCTTCSFRTFEDCAARRIFWRERRAAAATWPCPPSP